MIYEKDISEAIFSGNISPLHFENSKAVIVNSPELTERIQTFISPLFKAFPITYSGLDIAIDEQDKLFLIEANKSPAFNILERDNGIEPIVNLYTHILKDLLTQGE